MAAQRELIFSTLFARLAAIQSGGGAYFKYTSRILESWDDTPPSLMPAFFLVKGNEEANVKIVGAPSGWSLKASMMIYLSNGETTHEEPSVPPDIALNTAITLVEAALEAQPGEQRSPFATFPGKQPGYFTTTLGGLCYSCQIVGTVQVFDGTIAGTAVAIIPIEILTTG